MQAELLALLQELFGAPEGGDVAFDLPDAEAYRSFEPVLQHLATIHPTQARELLCEVLSLLLPTWSEVAAASAPDEEGHLRWPENGQPLALADLRAELVGMFEELFDCQTLNTPCIWRGPAQLIWLSDQGVSVEEWLQVQRSRAQSASCGLDVLLELGILLGMEQGLRGLFVGPQLEAMDRRFEAVMQSLSSSNIGMATESLPQLVRSLSHMSFLGQIRQPLIEGDTCLWPEEGPMQMGVLCQSLREAMLSCMTIERRPIASDFQWRGPALPQDLPPMEQMLTAENLRHNAGPHGGLDLSLQVLLYLSMEQGRRTLMCMRLNLVRRLARLTYAALEWNQLRGALMIFEQASRMWSLVTRRDLSSQLSPT